MYSKTGANKLYRSPLHHEDPFNSLKGDVYMLSMWYDEYKYT